MPAIPVHDPVDAVLRAARSAVPGVRAAIEAAAREHAPAVTDAVEDELLERKVRWEGEESARMAQAEDEWERSGRLGKRPARRQHPFPSGQGAVVTHEAIAAMIAVVLSDRLDAEVARPLAARAAGVSGARTTSSVLALIAAGAGLAGRQGVDKRIGVRVAPTGSPEWDQLVAEETAAGA